MNRIIKFRGKRLDNGAWETGCVVVTRQGITGEEWFIADKMTGYHTPVSRNTVGQFTGLHDKNGKEIYEGDIVEFDDSLYSVYAKPYTGKVVFYKGQFCVEHYEDCFTTTFYTPLFKDDFADKKTTVLGNIHDNPELLKGVEIEKAAEECRLTTAQSMGAYGQYHSIDECPEHGLSCIQKYPKRGDTYYYIVFSADAIVRIREETWEDEEVDRKLFRRGNFFKKIDDAILVGELLGKSFDKYLMIVKTKDNEKEKETVHKSANQRKTVGGSQGGGRPNESADGGQGV